MLGRTMAQPRECKLYVLPASHPCAAVEVAIGIKGIAYQSVVLLPLSQLMVGPLRYGGVTVPGLRVDGERVVGSRAIMRKLDELAPEPPLLPSDEALRTRVLDVERWGDEVLQSAVRRILDAGWVREPGSLESFAGDAKLPLPRAMLRPAMPMTARLMAIRNRVNDDSAAADVRALPAQLQRIDEWISEGVLSSDQPNAADLQVGSSLRLLRTVADLRDLVDSHAAASLLRHFPPMAGEIAAGVLPAEWLPRSGALSGAA